MNKSNRFDCLDFALRNNRTFKGSQAETAPGFIAAFAEEIDLQVSEMWEVMVFLRLIQMRRENPQALPLDRCDQPSR